MSVKRYDFGYDDDCEFIGLVGDAQGKWVSFDDHANALATERGKLEKADAENDRLTARVAAAEKDAARWQKLRALNNHDLETFAECLKRMKFSACESLIDKRQPDADNSVQSEQPDKLSGDQ